MSIAGVPLKCLMFGHRQKRLIKIQNDATSIDNDQESRIDANVIERETFHKTNLSEIINGQSRLLGFLFETMQHFVFERKSLLELASRSDWITRNI